MQTNNKMAKKKPPIELPKVIGNAQEAIRKVVNPMKPTGQNPNLPTSLDPSKFPVLSTTGTSNEPKNQNVEFKRDSVIVNGVEMSRKEYEGVLAAQRAGFGVESAGVKTNAPKTQEALATIPGTEQAQAAQQAQLEQIASRIGQEVAPTAQLPSGEVNPFALGSTLGGTALAGGAAVAFGTATAGIGAVALGLGAVVKLGVDIRQDVGQANKVTTTSFRNIKAIIKGVNAGTISPIDAVRQYNEEIANLKAARALLKWETRNNLSKFLSNAGDELINVESILRNENGMNTALAQAILTPNPNMAFIPDTEPQIEQ